MHTSASRLRRAAPVDANHDHSRAELAAPAYDRPSLAVSGLAVAPKAAESDAGTPAPSGLMVGRADDPAEHEAEATGARVLDALRRRALESESAPVLASTASRIARAGASGGREGGSVSTGTEQAIADVAARGGRPIPAVLRSPIERVMGADFSSVRLHSGPDSNALNAEVGAQAFTLGNDIFLGANAPALNSDAGVELLGHELTHAVQQRSAPATPVRRKLDEKQLTDMGKELGIEGKISAVEVPKDKKFRTTTKFSAYPDGSTMNLSPEIAGKSILELNYPGWETNPEYDADWKEYYGSEPATSVTDGLGGGAYNHMMDLVVLREPYTEPELVHEMGHKAQNEAGINADTASVLFLEYQNVLLHQNMNWWMRKEGAEPPRLQYSSTGISTAAIQKSFKISKPAQVTPEIWAEFKQQAGAALHHTHPEASGVLDSLDSLLGGRYAEERDAKGTFEQQAKFNLIAEYCTSRG